MPVDCPIGIWAGGIQFSIHAQNYPVVWGNTYRTFFRNGDPRCVVWANCRSRIEDPFAAHDPLFKANSWCLYDSPHGRALVRRDFGVNPVVNTAIDVDPDFRLARMQILDRESDRSTETGSFAPPLEPPWGVLLTVMILGKDSGIAVHSCGVDDSGKGYLFAGESGRGKSTMASLWDREARVLNDERIVVAAKDGRFWLHSTPWHGTYRQVTAQSVPLSKLFLIRHGSQNRVTRISPGPVAAGILPRCFLPIWDKAAMDNTLAFCSKLAQNIPCYDLEFVPNTSVLETVRCAS